MVGEAALGGLHDLFPTRRAVACREINAQDSDPLRDTGSASKSQQMDACGRSQLGSLIPGLRLHQCSPPRPLQRDELPAHRVRRERTLLPPCAHLTKLLSDCPDRAATCPSASAPFGSLAVKLGCLGSGRSPTLGDASLAPHSSVISVTFKIDLCTARQPSSLILLLQNRFALCSIDRPKGSSSDGPGRVLLIATHSNASRCAYGHAASPVTSEASE